MKLIGQLDSPFVRRVAVSMTWLGLPFERLPFSVVGDFEKVRESNPLGRVPTLILDDGTVLVDSNAIVDWLDEQAASDRTLFPKSGNARRECWRLIALTLGVDEKLVSIVYEYRMRPADKRVTTWIDRCRVQIGGALAALDSAAGDASPWLLGDRLTQADITVASMLSFLGLVEPVSRIAPPSAERLPNLARLGEACEALPAFIANAVPEEERPLPDDVSV